MDGIAKSTRAYERWLAERTPLIRSDLEVKHAKMAKNPFAFLRGSFFRWAQTWPDACPRLGDAPRVLAVGDLHVENFGTWRDIDGRLVWGINDFDEAELVPYTNDLVRLCTSALLAIEDSSERMSTQRACEAVLEGYGESLVGGGMPIVLGHRHSGLRNLVEARVEEEPQFWSRLGDLNPVRVPPPAHRLLARAMPERGLKFRVGHRIGGLGSLGRYRFTAVASWAGGLIAREAKAVTNSAWNWQRGGRSPIKYSRVLRHAVRLPDPSLRVHEGWVVRRLAPDCRKIEFKEVPRRVDLLGLLRLMGWETANIHLGSRRQRKRILTDLKQRKNKWLENATDLMTEMTIEDWREWRRGIGS